MSELINPVLVPPLLTQFVITALLSFIIGLELHSYRQANEQDLGFGTTRTFTLIGVSGLVLYLIDDQLLAFLAGFFALITLLGIYYYRRTGERLYSLLGPMIGLLTYLLGPVLVSFPNWFTILYVVTILLLLGHMPQIRRFSDAFRSAEIVTFSKFLIMAGVILPLLPDHQIADLIPVTYYQAWSALLVVSGLSYLSYLTQTYLVKEKGLLLTGMLGGLYSSTATTIVLSRRARAIPQNVQTTQALILATAMMYLRLLLLVFFLGHFSAGQRLLPLFLGLVAASLIAIWAVSRMPTKVESSAADVPLSHPLEFRTALLFAFLFTAFAAITAYVIARYGSQGLHLMSFVVGVTDIDPFILSLLSGTFQVTEVQLISAVIIASASNNLLKAGYAIALGRNRSTALAAGWLITLFAISMIYVFWFLA